MANRITINALNNTVLADNQRTIARMATYQEQLSSGKRINRVSDDPGAARSALRYRAESVQTSKYLDNIAKGESFVNASDSALEQMSQVLDDAKSLAVQGANGTQDAASRKALSQSVDSLLTRMVDLSNTVHDGRYIFAGTATNTQPFARSSDGQSVVYQGNLDEFEIQIGPDSRVTVNQDGNSLFQQDGDVFSSLVKLRNALASNDASTVSSLVQDVDDAHTHLNDLHGALGGTEQRMELARNQLESAKVNLDSLVSESEDVDFADTIAQMQLAQVALEAGLQAGSRVLRPSLLDYL
ncbi:MAG TPA: flagellar hook-associated protein FlgL [Planctomycetota bacterium]|jgi:flagellar hook-associated protein 3 FlgL|nr:flagellar hook-associated protein FlgL [Planctomycetota bacterium]